MTMSVTGAFEGTDTLILKGGVLIYSDGNKSRLVTAHNAIPPIGPGQGPRLWTCHSCHERHYPGYVQGAGLSTPGTVCSPGELPLLGSEYAGVVETGGKETHLLQGSE